MRILLVEDDRKGARILGRGLEEEGFTVDIAHNGGEAEVQVDLNEYDLIVLDWLLPGKSGIDICRDIRARGASTPILMLTAKDAIEDRVTGLNTGADDYLVKPFAFDELLARVRALLRRATETRLPQLAVGDLVLDPVTHRVTRDGRHVDLTAKEYVILEYLAAHTGEVMSRTRISEHVWQDQMDNLTNLVDVHVSHIRKKINCGDARPLLHTVRGRGYRLSADGN